MIRVLTSLLALTLPTLASADCTVVTGALVHTPEGPAEGLTVRWEDGRITDVAEAVDTAGCTAVDGTDHQLTAGLVATGTHLGLVEIELESSTRHDRGEGTVDAALQVIDGYDPLSSVVRVTRLGGITSATTHPGGGFVSGQAGLVRLAGTTQAEAVIDRSVGLEVHLGAMPGTGEALLRLRELLDDARYVAQSRRDPRTLRLSDLSASRLDLDALAPVIAGRLPLVVHADRAADLEALARLATQQGIRLVIVGAAEGWVVADTLADAGVGVIVDPLVYGAGGFDQRHGRPDNAALLVKAGVPVALSDGETHNSRTLRFLAGNAVRGGLGHTEALAAITAVPAALFGAEDRGVIAAGAVADLALWTGDPLDIPTRLAGLWIDGRPVDRTSRQTELVEAWRDPQARRPVALPSDVDASDGVSAD